MLLKEFLLSLKRNFILNFLASLLILFSLILIFVSMFYVHEGRLAHIGYEDEFGNEVIMTNISINPWVPFNVEHPNQMRDFYQELISRNEFTAFNFHNYEIELKDNNHGIPLQLSFKYRHGWGLESFNSIEGFLINYNFLKLFPLAVIEGRDFAVNDFSYYEGSIPVIMGDSFRPYFNLNDVFDGMILGHPFQLEVVGFLAENHPVPEFSHWVPSVDESILFPFMDFGGSEKSNETPVSADWSLFLHNFYRSGIQTWIRLEDAREALDDAINAIDSIAEHYGLPMIFSGMNPELVENTITRNIITMNLEAIKLFLIAACLLISTVLYYFSKVKHLRKQHIYESLSLLGLSKYKQMAMVLLENLIFTMPAIFAAIYYIFFWSSLVTDWPTNPLGKWELFRLAMFHPDVVNGTSFLVWSLALYGLGFYIIQNVYPIFKLLKIYKGDT